MPSMYEIDEGLKKKYGTKCNTYEMFPVGTRVQNIVQCEDFHFFEGDEKGTVCKNSGIGKDYRASCGVIVKFDEPIHYKDGRVQKSFGFDPDDLIILKDEECDEKPKKKTLEDLVVGRSDNHGYYKIGHVRKIYRKYWSGSGGYTYYAKIRLDTDDRLERLVDEYVEAGGVLKESKECSYTIKETCKDGKKGFLSHWSRKFFK